MSLYTAEAGWTEEVFEAEKANLAHALNALHDGGNPRFGKFELLNVAEVDGLTG